MIQRIESRAQLAQQLSCAQNDCLTVQLCAAAQCFGVDDGWCGFYKAGDALLMVQGASAVLCGKADSQDELAAFCRLVGVVSVWARSPLLSAKARVAMVHRNFSPPGLRRKAAADIQRSPGLWQLSRSGLIDGDAQAYYAAVCRMVNAQTARIYTVEREGMPVASAGAYAITPQAAYLSGVATLPAYRRRGYAGALVTQLCAELAPRTVLLVCRQQQCAFYRALGFVQQEPVYECLLTE